MTPIELRYRVPQNYGERYGYKQFLAAAQFSELAAEGEPGWTELKGVGRVSFDVKYLDGHYEACVSEGIVFSPGKYGLGDLYSETAWINDGRDLQQAYNATIEGVVLSGEGSLLRSRIEVAAGEQELSFYVDNNLLNTSRQEKVVIGALLVMSEEMFRAVGERGLVCVERMDSRGVVNPENVVVAKPAGEGELEIYSMRAMGPEMERVKEFLRDSFNVDENEAPIGVISTEHLSELLIQR